MRRYRSEQGGVTGLEVRHRARVLRKAGLLDVPDLAPARQEGDQGHLHGRDRGVERGRLHGVPAAELPAREAERHTCVRGGVGGVRALGGLLCRLRQGGVHQPRLRVLRQRYRVRLRGAEQRGGLAQLLRAEGEGQQPAQLRRGAELRRPHVEVLMGLELAQELPADAARDVGDVQRLQAALAVAQHGEHRRLLRVDGVAEARVPGVDARGDLDVRAEVDVPTGPKGHGPHVEGRNHGCGTHLRQDRELLQERAGVHLELGLQLYPHVPWDPPLPPRPRLLEPRNQPNDHRIILARDGLPLQR
mmetsp:Transcript_79379/g.233217  ORF Transcript_79379/g.233217 Transcript_79379/m.233217 type:complete len:303 (-) Transcript_79379:373-1281(-)